MLHEQGRGRTGTSGTERSDGFHRVTEQYIRNTNSNKGTNAHQHIHDPFTLGVCFQQPYRQRYPERPDSHGKNKKAVSKQGSPAGQAGIF